MRSLVQDVSTLTTIPEKYLEKLTEKALYSINDAVEESLLTNEAITEIDIGIGTLIIKIEDNEIKYKFVPSKRLNSSIRNTFIDKKNVLETVLEETLVNRITTVYKDLL